MNASNLLEDWAFSNEVSYVFRILAITYRTQRLSTTLIWDIIKSEELSASFEYGTYDFDVILLVKIVFIAKIVP